jgi:predicted MFS family arabinose efflux permease
MPLFAWVAIVISSVAAMPGNVLPVLTTLFGAHHHIDEATVGYLISANTFAGLLASGAGPWWIGRVRYRPLMSACFAIHAVCLVGIGQVHDVPALLALQLVLGASAMVMASVLQTIFAQLPRPERAFGIKISTDMTFAALFLACVPVARIGLPGFVGLLAIPFVASALAARLLPRGLDDRASSPREDRVAVSTGRAPLAVWIALLAMVTFNVGGLGVWTFIGHFGTAAGLDADSVANAVAIGLFGGIAGALGAAAYAGRGSIAPEVVAGIGCVLSMPAMALSRNAVEFTAANVMLNVCWNFFAPFLVGIVARRDPTRRLNTLVPAAVMIGGIVGPPLTGTLLHLTSTLATAIAMMAIALPSIGVYAALMRAGNARRELTLS